MAQRREQLIQEGMPPEQLENVLAEFRKQEIKAAKDTKAVNSIAKKQGSESVGGDEAVAIAGLAAGSAVAGEAGEVAAGSAVAEAGEVPAGSAVAGEAEQDVFWLKDAPVPEEDDGFGPALPPQGSAEPLLPGALPLEHPTSASPPRPKKQRIQFAVAVPIEGPNKEYLSEVQDDINVIMRHKAFKHIAQEEPLPITKDAACGIQEPFNSGQCVTALDQRGTYMCGFNFFWLDLLRSPSPGIPLSRRRVKELGDWMFKEGITPSRRPSVWQSTALTFRWKPTRAAC